MQEGLIAQRNAREFEAQKNVGNFEGPEECREVCGLRKMQGGVRAQKNAGSFEVLEECRKV